MRNVQRWADKFPQYRRGATPGEAAAYLLTGAAIGAGLAILLTPRSGHEVRDAIGRGCRKTVDSLSGGAQQLRDRAHHLGDDLRERVPNLLGFRRRARTVGETGVSETGFNNET